MYIKKLNDLVPGEWGIIKNIDNIGSMRRRLIDLGFAEKSKVRCILTAPLGDPKAFYIKGTVIALREEDSSKINILGEKTGF